MSIANTGPMKRRRHPSGRDAARGLSAGLRPDRVRTRRRDRCVAPVGQRAAARTPLRESGDGAAALAKLFGNSPEFWLNAQRAVDLWDAAQAIKDDVDRIKPLHAA